MGFPSLWRGNWFMCIFVLLNTDVTSTMIWGNSSMFLPATIIVEKLNSDCISDWTCCSDLWWKGEISWRGHRWIRSETRCHCCVETLLWILLLHHFVSTYLLGFRSYHSVGTHEDIISEEIRIGIDRNSLRLCYLPPTTSTIFVTAASYTYHRSGLSNKVDSA